MIALLRFVLPSLALLLTACGPSSNESSSTAGPRYGAAPPASDKPLYRLAVHPLHNPAKLMQSYQPLIEHLNNQIPEAHFELEASRDYAAFEEKYRARQPDFLLPNPWQTLQAIKANYRVIAMAGDAEDFKGIFIVRRDSNIRTPADLKGKAISYPSPTALAACIMPQYFLHQHGIDIKLDIDNRYVGSQESSIMNAYMGDTAAGATWPPPWRAFQKDHPKEAAELMIAFETPPLMNNSVMARNDLPSSLATRVQQILIQLHETPAGQGILANMETARFHAADNASYQPVADYVARFEREVRPVEQR